MESDSQKRNHLNLRVRVCNSAPLWQWFSAGPASAYQLMFAMYEDIFDAHSLESAVGGGGYWHQWIEARVAATFYSAQGSTTNIFLIQSVYNDGDMWYKD